MLGFLGAIGDRAIRDIDASNRARAGIMPEGRDVEAGIPSAVEDFLRRVENSGVGDGPDFKRLRRFAEQGHPEARRIFNRLTGQR